MAAIYEIIDEGFADSTMDQMLNHFGEKGTTPVYVRAFDSKKYPEIMLASIAPITDDVFTKFCKAKAKEEDDEY